MKILRMIVGYGSLACLALSLNLLVLRENLFTYYVVVPFVAGLVGGLLWMLLSALAQLQEGKSLQGLNTGISIALFLGICITIYAYAQHFDKSWDLTQEGRRKLSEQTQKVLRGLDRDIGVTCFFPVSGDALTDVVRTKTMRFLERCESLSLHLKVEFIDPQKKPERVQALKVNRISSVGTVVITCGTRQRVLPLSDVTSRLEERDFTNALINVLRDSEPTICFLTGHGERRITDQDAKNGGSMLKAWLEKESYKTREVAMRLADAAVPHDCDVLFINGLNGDMNPVEIRAIQEYLDSGGRMLVLLDPWVVQNAGMGATEQFRPWLSWRYGINVGGDILLSKLKTEQHAVMDLLPDFTQLADYGFDLDPTRDSRGSYSMSHPITRGFDQQMSLRGARSVTLADAMPEGVVGTEILRTMADTWAETDTFKFYKKHQASPGPDETQGSIGVASAVTAKTDIEVGTGASTRDTRIVVVGNTVFASNDQLGYPGHHNFVLNAVAWLCENEELIAIRPVGDEEQPIILTQQQQQTIAWIASLGVVQIVALMGLGAHALRRKYQ